MTSRLIFMPSCDVAELAIVIPNSRY